MNDSSELTSSQPEFHTFGACEIELLRSFCLIIFGAAGDLSKRKLVPALFHLFQDGLLPDDFFIFCTDRVEMDTEQYRAVIKNALAIALPKDFKRSAWLKFVKRIYYSQFNYTDQDSYRRYLKEKLNPLEKKHQTNGNRVFYLAIPPSILESVIVNLGEAGLSAEEHGYSHIVIEKPFGRSLETARDLNKVLTKFFKEKQIFRIDHYVAKETVQNKMENLADMENWNRVFAANHAAGNWDCWGLRTGQNLYMYVSPKIRWSLFMFDFNIVFGVFKAWAPGSDLETADGAIWQHFHTSFAPPEFQRMYWRALKELVDGPMISANVGAFVDSRYAALMADGLTASSPDTIKTWVSQARSSIAASLAARDTANYTLATTNVSASNGRAVLSGHLSSRRQTCPVVRTLAQDHQRLRSLAPPTAGAARPVGQDQRAGNCRSAARAVGRTEQHGAD